MDPPVADAGLGVGVREQPVQPGAAALVLTDPLGGLRLGLAEGGVDQRRGFSARALGVRAHDRHGRHKDAERARAVVAVERGDVEVEAVGAADRERGDVGCEWVAGPVCRRSTVRQAIGLASGSGVALRMWVAPRIGAVRPRCLTQRRIDDVGSSVAGL